MLERVRGRLGLLAGMVLLVVGTAAASCSPGQGSEFADDDDANQSGTGTGASGGSTGFGGGLSTGGGGPVSGIPQTCSEAISQESYIGCEYWPTVTSNEGLFTGFKFAVVAANPTESAADVTVARGGVDLVTTTVPPGQLEVIELDWVAELKQADPGGDGSGLTSKIVVGGAYHLTSSVPITLYQFNPLEFELTPAPFACPDPSLTGKCFSYTNDASILLPTSALGTKYYTATAPTLHLGFKNGGTQETNWLDSPGFVAVTATQDDTSVEVTVAGHVRSGSLITALAPGETGSYVLNSGDVLMLSSAALPAQETPEAGKPCEENLAGYDASFNPIYSVACPSASDYDLTGSHVVADKPVSVISGHDCTFVPYNRFACDHIEESMLPDETLGQDLIVTAPHSVAAIGVAPGTPDAMFVRVVSAVDGNQINFDPVVSAPVTLDAGKWVEVGPVSQDFKVHADNKILVSQYMVGENFSGVSAGAGDPALSVAIPLEQYRTSYEFLAPGTYTHSFVNVVAETGTTVMLNGAAVPMNEFAPIGGTGYSVARHKIVGGNHTMWSEGKFGIVVYGYGSYTSYMYPAGLNLDTVVIVPD